MGILDHQRTWRFRVGAESSECIAAFHRGLGRSINGGLMKCKWKTQTGRSESGTPMVVAAYDGRSGFSGFMTSLSTRATSEEEAAKGSKLNFEICGVDDDGRTICDMWMSVVTIQGVVFTADGRFFRGYMNGVERALRECDPNLDVAKG